MGGTEQFHQSLQLLITCEVNLYHVMTANSGRVKHMYVRWWGSSCTLNEMNNTWAFQNNTFMWNEDALGGTPTHMGLHIRAVWGGEELTPRKASAKLVRI